MTQNATAQDVLRETSTEGLIDAVIQFTHRIHVATVAPLTAARECGDYADDLRVQRDLVRAELVRRAGA